MLCYVVVVVGGGGGDGVTIGLTLPRTTSTPKAERLKRSSRKPLRDAAVRSCGVWSVDCFF